MFLLIQQVISIEKIYMNLWRDIQCLRDSYSCIVWQFFARPGLRPTFLWDFIVGTLFPGAFFSVAVRSCNRVEAIDMKG